MKTMLFGAFVVALAAPAWADDPAAKPKPIPPTRDAMKRALEDLKKRAPRLPMPPAPKSTDGKPVVNNGLMRTHYLPPEFREAGFSRGPEPGMTLDNTFKVMLFWIVSRVNNCHYCLGHQEAKLASAGVEEDRRAALDGGWAEFTPAERAAFAFTRKLALDPHTVTAADLDALRTHYKDVQILEMVHTVGSFASMNRWTDSLGIPQEANPLNMKTPSFLTPTADRYKGQSQVCPLGTYQRPPLESRAEVEAALAAARKREPRISLVDEATARAALPANWPAGPLPQHVRLLAHFPKGGLARAASLRAAAEGGRLPPLLRAQIDWTAARQDRAWYALGLAQKRLTDLGQSDDAIFALDGDAAGLPSGSREALAFVRTVTARPFAVTDADIAGLRKHFNDFEVAEIVHRACNAAYFNRLTEPFALRLEP